MIRKHSLLTLLCLLALLANAPVFAAQTTPPSVDTPTFGTVTSTSAVLGGTVRSIGSDPINEVGVEWGTTPGVYDFSQLGSYPGLDTPFVETVITLSPGTTYYFRAWASNTGKGQNTGYTVEETITTLSSAGPPTLDTSTLSSLATVTSSTATLGGNIDSDGGDTVTDHGTVWNAAGGAITENPSLEGAAGAIPFTFSTLRDSLPSGTQVHFRSYAANINGTDYGPDNSFYTEPATSPASATIDAIGDTSFRINWPANPAGSGDGALVVISINSILATPTDGTQHAFDSVFGTGGTDIGTSEFVVYRGTDANNVTVTGLTDTTSYNVAVFYSAGTGSGETGTNYRQTTPATNSQTTNTPAVAPTVTVATPSTITSDSALLGGDVTNNGGATVTDRGIWWHTSSPPESGGTQVPIGSGDGPFSQTVSLSPAGTTIYVRAYATNSAGTSVSTVIESFDTLVGLPTVDTPTVADITGTTATLGGRVFSDGGGTITQRGTVWGTAPDPDIVVQATNVNIVAGTTGIFSGPVIDLPTGTLVYYRAYATNSAGTAYSASDSFTPSSPPIMGVPTLGTLNYFSAVLGGIITSDGGNPILSRGTVWNTTGSPVIETDNPLAEGGTAVSEAFSHTRFLTAGDDVFYRAYATSVVGTGYSTQGSFTVPTQPDVQATLVTFPRIAANSLRISWTPGNGEGRIVVLRLTGNGITAPQDGDDYTASPDLSLAPELPVNSQNFVVYKGTNNAVVVTGLTINTSYSVAVYEYAGTGAAIDYRQPVPAEGTQSTNDIPVHNLDNNVDCNECHSHGTYATYVPQDAELKTVCENCHRIGGVAAAKLEFDNHLTPGKNPAIDFVDCGYCHEVHNPNAVDTTESEHSIDLITRTNKSFLRANVSKYVPTAAEPAYLHTDQPLREAPHPEAPLAADNPDRAVENGDDTTARGYCQVCHTLTNYHTNNPSTSLSDQCHDGDTGNCGPAETNCGNCHQHNNKFIGVGGTTTCIQCHDSEVGSTITRAIITTQFDRNSTHITGGSAAVTQPDCLVCHNQGGHQAGKINAWNADDGSTNYVQLNPFVPTTNTGEGEQYEGHCMSCHDDGVASSLPGTGDQTDTSPFIGSNAPPVIDQSAWDLAGHNRKQGGIVLASPPLDPAVPITAGTEVTCLGNGVNGCHGSAHGSEQNSLLAPVTGAAISPTDFCFNCHDGAPGQDIQLQFGNSVPDTSLQTTSNSGADVNQRHDIYIDDQLYSGGSVTCKDCHSPHVDSAANPVADPDTGLALNTYSPANSYTEDGNNFSYDAGGNQDPTNPEGGSGLIPEPDYIQFCLTCHDGTTPAGVTMSASMVDIASVYGGKQHGGGEGSSGSKTGKGNLKVPWTTSGDFSAGNDPSNPYAAMNCTLCHGAHGSPSIFNLRESINVAGVDMTVGAIAGSGEFQVGTFADPDGDLKTYTLPINGGTQGDHQYGAWCTFCHDMNAHAGVDETTTCTSAHMHGSNSF